MLSSLLFSLLLGDFFLGLSQRFFRSKAREYTPQAHRAKDNKPTMGGVLILVVVVINTLLWCDILRIQVWIFLFCILGFGAVGFWDDWNKIRHHTGINSGTKFKLQLLTATSVVLALVFCTSFSTELIFPFFKHFNPNVGYLFIPWAVFIIVGCSNAVNLTDGLDGLAIGSLLPNFATFSLICYFAGHYGIAHYLHIPFAGSAEIAIIGAILIGSSLGFLWYNTYPAQIFMGDVGSLALGAALALMAIMAKQELLLPLAGGLFVVETVSVILQVFSIRYLGKRIFKMAPIHHHFELLGWPESKITARFGIISLVLCLLTIITLKLR
ncbi:MAG TPA: phospho-N-acetylmuramoyl-pentapeptide-transferase [Candidatus Babeliales bacterium]|nr:phospho-N-acetylmuramoyl-pentapeptide-transferase [Candidatus Babeliales bacterium]